MGIHVRIALRGAQHTSGVGEELGEGVIRAALARPGDAALVIARHRVAACAEVARCEELLPQPVRAGARQASTAITTIRHLIVTPQVALLRVCVTGRPEPACARARVPAVADGPAGGLRAVRARAAGCVPAGHRRAESRRAGVRVGSAGASVPCPIHRQSPDRRAVADPSLGAALGSAAPRRTLFPRDALRRLSALAEPRPPCPKDTAAALSVNALSRHRFGQDRRVAFDRRANCRVWSPRGERETRQFGENLLLSAPIRGRPSGDCRATIDRR